MKTPIVEKVRGVRAKVLAIVSRVELLIITNGETIERNSDGDYEAVAFEHVVFEITELAIRS